MIPPRTHGERGRRDLRERLADEARGAASEHHVESLGVEMGDVQSHGNLLLQQILGPDTRTGAEEDATDQGLRGAV